MTKVTESDPGPGLPDGLRAKLFAPTARGAFCGGTGNIPTTAGADVSISTDSSWNQAGNVVSSGIMKNPNGPLVQLAPSKTSP